MKRNGERMKNRGRRINLPSLSREDWVGWFAYSSPAHFLRKKTSMDEQKDRAGTSLLTAVAMTAFAANSILCRMALGDRAIDAASFTAVRLASGAAALVVLSLVLRGRHAPAAGSWLSGLQLSLYAVAFSFAYLSLSAGTGALILFGSVQATMILSGLLHGERPNLLQWAGLVVALAGLVYLVSPGVTAPSTGGSLLMALAGIAWGLYSLRGRGQKIRSCRQREISSRQCR
jgi:drug/metabolite transporter (DMT)-like permease